MNPTRWHVEEMLRWLEHRAADKVSHGEEARAAYSMSADIVREVMALPVPVCKCGHAYDVHRIWPDGHALCFFDLERHDCQCKKYDPAPKVSE